MDRISSLPDGVIIHILSFLPLEKSAQTSVLSKRWRILFAFSPNLDLLEYKYDGIMCQQSFEDSEDDSENDSQDDIEDDSEDESEDDSKNDSRGSFVDFIDKVLAVSGNFPIKKFAISCDIGFRTDRWIRDVLNRGGVLDLDLRLGIDDAHLPSEIFTCKTLVELKLTGFCIKELHEDTFLPDFKKLVLKSVQFNMSLLHIIPRKAAFSLPRSGGVGHRWFVELSFSIQP